MGEAPAEREPAPSAAQVAAARERIAAGGAEVRRGRALFADEGCDRCHSIAAIGAEGKLGPRLDTLDEDLDDNLESIAEPREDIADGYPEKLMPATSTTASTTPTCERSRRSSRRRRAARPRARTTTRGKGRGASRPWPIRRRLSRAHRRRLTAATAGRLLGHAVHTGIPGATDHGCTGFAASSRRARAVLHHRSEEPSMAVEPKRSDASTDHRHDLDVLEWTSVCAPSSPCSASAPRPAAAALRRRPERRRQLGARRRPHDPAAEARLAVDAPRRRRAHARGHRRRRRAPGRPAAAVLRPQTADGIPYEQIARLHGRHVLATTVVQTCVRYKRDSRCRFCTIEESLQSGTTTQVKLAEQIAEVALAAVRLDGVRQLVMTTGTSNGPDRGARHLARCVAAVKDVLPNLPIQVQIEPPDDLVWIRRLHAAGVTAIGIHVESLDEEVRARWTPGKASVPLERYEEAWDGGRHGLRPQPRLDVPAHRPRREPRRARQGRRAAHRHGRLPVRRARTGRSPARSRTTTTASRRRATSSSRTSPTASAARCARRACAAPTSAPAARPAAPARR